MIKQITKITPAQIASKGVSALSDKPNANLQYGVGGLSPTQLKQWFDKLAIFIAERLNEVSDVLASDEAAKYVRIALDSLGVQTLDDVVLSFQSGAFAASLLKVYPSAADLDKITLQEYINASAKKFSDIDKKIGSLVEVNPGIAEAQRRENEIVRQQKEAERQLAETERQSNEESREENIKLAMEIVKRVNLATSFESYQALVDDFNVANNQKYKVGQSLYILTKDVPDLWVAYTESDLVPYTYVDDESFINELLSVGSVRIGCYKVAALETLKEIVTNAELPLVTTEDNGKILQVVNGAWSAAKIPNAEGVGF